MSAETLRRAATRIREDWPDCECHGFERAVADWLDHAHANLSTHNAMTERNSHAFTVARAYLREQS